VVADSTYHPVHPNKFIPQPMCPYSWPIQASFLGFHLFHPSRKLHKTGDSFFFAPPSVPEGTAPLPFLPLWKQVRASLDRLCLLRHDLKERSVWPTGFNLETFSTPVFTVLALSSVRPRPPPFFSLWDPPSPLLGLPWFQEFHYCLLDNSFGK